MLLCIFATFRPKLSESERRKIAAGMNMTPISMEYETELKYDISLIYVIV